MESHTRFSVDWRIVAVGKARKWNVCIGRCERTGFSFHVEISNISIPGGSEEIMIDLAMRQSLKVAQTLGAKL